MKLGQEDVVGRTWPIVVYPEMPTADPGCGNEIDQSEVEPHMATTAPSRILPMRDTCSNRRSSRASACSFRT